MRFIIIGAGAIGGTVAGLLSLSGARVAVIARGTQLAAIRARGLTLHRPGGTRTIRLDCHETPAEARIGPDDVVLLAVKSQHTAHVLGQLVAAGVEDQPIFCLQNGVDNERSALRQFPNVHGVTVMMPSDFVTPGEVAAFGSPNSGFFDIGRYPRGSDDIDKAVAAALDRAGMPAFVTDDVMASKYGKLLMNLGNIVESACGRGEASGRLTERLRDEARGVLRAAGIEWREVGREDARRAELMQTVPIEGISRTGNSSLQSLTRNAGSLETAYLNGEIVLLGRLHGVPVPANEWFSSLAPRLVADPSLTGTFDPGEVLARVAAVASAS